MGGWWVAGGLVGLAGLVGWLVGLAGLVGWLAIGKIGFDLKFSYLICWVYQEKQKTRTRKRIRKLTV